MRRNIRCHTHGDTACAINEDIWIARGQNDRLLLFPIIIILEVDGVLLNIGQKAFCRAVHTNFGISHRRRAIAVN